MLHALETGVKGGVWFSLIDKVYSRRNLEAAAARVASNDGAAGVDHVTVAAFTQRLDANLNELEDGLRSDTYRPQPIRRKEIPKPGKPGQTRPLGIPTVRDRTVQTALRNVLEPIFERNFHEHSYGFRPGRGCKDALRRVQQLLAEGYVWVVDADLKSYFDTIPHERLMALLGRKVSDSRVLALIEAFLTQGIMQDGACWTPEEGTPQGAVLSPLLSNVYLDPLDHALATAGFEMVRYADDFVILCRNRAEAEAALALVQAWTKEAGLTLHPDKTRLVDAREKGGFDFLGYHFERGLRWPSKKSLTKLKDAIRTKTKRNNGHCLQFIIRDVTLTLRGWFEYFKHSTYRTFTDLDKWIRGRLRSILRKRRGLRGRGRGADHVLYPNKFFTEHGLFNLTAARRSAAQPSRR
jgi:RNA-directed DNA polymerase